MNPDTQDKQHRDQEEGLQHAAEHEKPRKPQSVLIYLVILFAAAFVLLAWTFLMQQRSSSETIAGLRESVSAMESVQTLQEDNDALRQQVAGLEDQVEELLQENAQLSREDGARQDEVDSLTAQIQALQRLNQLRALYNDGAYSRARALLEEWGEPGGQMEELLSQASASLTEEEREIYDPAQAFRDLVDWLG